jgi:hypothetical protein
MLVYQDKLCNTKHQHKNTYVCRWMWLMIQRCIPDRSNSAPKLYELLSWPTRVPFDKIVSNQELEQEPEDLRSGQMSPTAYWKCVSHGLYALCRKRGVSRTTLKGLLLGIRRVALSCSTSDMSNVTSLGATERMCVEISIKQTCYATLKFSERLPLDKASALLSASLKVIDAVSTSSCRVCKYASRCRGSCMHVYICCLVGMAHSCLEVQ